MFGKAAPVTRRRVLVACGGRAATAAISGRGGRRRFVPLADALTARCFKTFTGRDVDVRFAKRTKPNKQRGPEFSRVFRAIVETRAAPPLRRRWRALSNLRQDFPMFY